MTRKNSKPYEIITKSNKYDSAIVKEADCMIEVRFELNLETLEPREITYRMLTYLNDPLARWIAQSQVTNYVSKEGIDEAIRVIAKAVRKQKSFINKAKKHPAYKTMNALVKKHLRHYATDFNVHDLMFMGRDLSAKFIWMVREAGTHLVVGVNEWDNVTIDNELKEKNSKGILYFDGQNVREISRDELKRYQALL